MSSSPFFSLAPLLSQLLISVAPALAQGCQMAKFDPFLSSDCARVEGVGTQSKERKGSNFAIWQHLAKAGAALMSNWLKRGATAAGKKEGEDDKEQPPEKKKK